MKKILSKLLLIVLLLAPLAANATAEAQMATVFHPVAGHRKAVVVNNPSAFDGGYILEIGYFEEEEVKQDDEPRKLGRHKTKK